jgi:hypothetical protein
MSQLTPLLRQITKKASHPNGLLYSLQLERARVKYLVKGELESGTEAVALDSPKEKAQEMTGRESGGDMDVERESAARNEEACKGKEG